MDCYIYLGNSKSLNLAVNLAYYIHERFEKLHFWKIDGILRCTKVNPVNEFGGIGDVIYTLFTLTGDDKLLALAKIFDKIIFLNILQRARMCLKIYMPTRTFP